MTIKYGYIYSIENKETGKVYVGQHKSPFFDNSYWGSGTLIQRAIKKYGCNSFNRNLLCWAESRQELNTLEKKFIENLNSLFPNGYNLRDGGSKEFTEISKRKLSESQRSRWASYTKEKKMKIMKKIYSKNLGRVQTEEEKKMRSEKSPNKGKILVPRISLICTNCKNSFEMLNWKYNSKSEYVKNNPTCSYQCRKNLKKPAHNKGKKLAIIEGVRRYI